MRGKYQQLKYRKDKGDIESNKDALRRLTQIKECKRKIKEKNSEVENKLEFKFSIYKNNSKKKMELRNKAIEKLSVIDFEIKKITRKLQSEFCAVEHKNTKIIFSEDDVETKEMRFSREISGREARLREQLKSYEEQKENITYALKTIECKEKAKK